MGKKKTLFSTQEVYDKDGCSKPTALKWANRHGVEKVGPIFIWKKSEVEQFFKRDKSPGRRPVKRRRK